MKIGKYNIEALETGRFSLDGGAMFGIIPKPLWEKSNPADEVNRVALSTRSMLLRSGKRNILVDTGMGQKWDEKSKKIYNIQNDNVSAEYLIAKKGLSPDDITDVILTHLHFDHTGGSTKLEDGKLIPAFPNARYIIQKKNYEWALNPSDRDKGSYIKDNFVPLMEEGVVKFVSGDTLIDDEIELIPVNGHTYNQQLIRISDGNETLLYCGDLIPFSSHVHLPFIMGYDLQPLITLEEKKKILKSAVDENWILFFEHDPFSAGARVELTEKGYRVKQRIEIA